MPNHNPLLLCTKQNTIKKTKHFYFETSWMKHENFLPKIKEIWGKQSVQRMQQKSGSSNWAELKSSSRDGGTT
jgi:hypothetical protein